MKSTISAWTFWRCKFSRTTKINVLWAPLIFPEPHCKNQASHHQSKQIHKQHRFSCLLLSWFLMGHWPCQPAIGNSTLSTLPSSCRVKARGEKVKNLHNHYSCLHIQVFNCNTKIQQILWGFQRRIFKVPYQIIND